MALKEIKVLVKHNDYVDQDQQRHVFDSYKAVQADGKLIDLRFKEVVKNRPTENSILVIDEADMNINNNYEFKRLWVAKVIEIKPIEIKKPELPF